VCLDENPFLHQSADFILGLPYTTKEETLSQMRNFIQKHPAFNHLSCYMLEAGTYPSKWENISPDGEEIASTYTSVVKTLA